MSQMSKRQQWQRRYWAKKKAEQDAANEQEEMERLFEKWSEACWEVMRNGYTEFECKSFHPQTYSIVKELSDLAVKEGGMPFFKETTK